MGDRAAQHPVFAQRLAQARKRVGLSQAEVGVRAGMDPAVASARINQYERGKHEPQLRTAKRLADVLGIPAAFLFTEDDLLAEVLLRWNDLTDRQKKDVLKQVEGATASSSMRRQRK